MNTEKQPRNNKGKFQKKRITKPYTMRVTESEKRFLSIVRKSNFPLMPLKSADLVLYKILLQFQEEKLGKDEIVQFLDSLKERLQSVFNVLSEYKEVINELTDLSWSFVQDMLNLLPYYRGIIVHRINNNIPIDLDDLFQFNIAFEKPSKELLEHPRICKIVEILLNQ